MATVIHPELRKNKDLELRRRDGRPGEDETA
jgi:hypothetical protein